MGIFLRQLYKQKPQAFGPPSEVQSSIFANADRAGIDPGSIGAVTPFWGPGDHINYVDARLATATNTLYSKSAVYFPNNASNKVAFPNPVITGHDFTILLREYSSGTTNVGYFVGDADDAENLYFRRRITDPELYDYGIADIIAIYQITVPRNTWNSIGLINRTVGSSYIFEGKINSNTRSNSFAGIGSTLMVGNRSLNDRNFFGYIDNLLVFNVALSPVQIAYQHDNPYFLLHRQPSVFYSVPSGAITLRQFGFQFYQDNADHTPIGTENDASVSLAPGSKIRIRMGIVKE